ncbi:hypothetical protein J7K56_01220 [Candidatus Calescamantes bacterium]|nr:hypothetical protein [Candidatus Calescamantes bacterium]
MERVNRRGKKGFLFILPFLVITLLCGFRWSFRLPKPEVITSSYSWIRADIIGIDKNYIVFKARFQHLGPTYLMLYSFRDKTIRKLKEKPVKSYQEDFYGEWIVYKVGKKIYLMNINTGRETPLNLTGRPGELRIWGERIVYRNYEDGTIHVYNFKKKEDKALGKGFGPRIGEEWVVWMTTAGVFKAFHLPSGKTKNVTLGGISHDDYDMRKGILVASVGEEHREDIYAYDLNQDRKILISSLPDWERYVATDGEYVVWMGPIKKEEFRPIPTQPLLSYNIYRNIYLYNLSKRKMKRIVHGDFSVLDLKIGGGKVVWTSGRNKRPETATQYNRNPFDIYIYYIR